MTIPTFAIENCPVCKVKSNSIEKRNIFTPFADGQGALVSCLKCFNKTTAYWIGQFALYGMIGVSSE